MLLDLGIKYWRVIEVDPIGRARDNDEILLDADGLRRMVRFIREKQQDGKMEVTYGCGHYLGEDKDFTIRDMPYLCYTGAYVGSVLSNGDIFVCPDVKRRPELIQGNIRKDNFIEVWETKFKPYRKMTRTSNAKCRRCKSFKICGGDAFHTWDFDENKPLICARELFKEEFEMREKLQAKKKKEIEKLRKNQIDREVEKLSKKKEVKEKKPKTSTKKKTVKKGLK
jgi:radical SAM protein with 4Fe4S-binding SPASM domain